MKQFCLWHPKKTDHGTGDCWLNPAKEGEAPRRSKVVGPDAEPRGPVPSRTFKDRKAYLKEYMREYMRRKRGNKAG